jgi:hypothetical protein
MGVIVSSGDELIDVVPVGPSIKLEFHGLRRRRWKNSDELLQGIDGGGGQRSRPSGTASITSG